MVSFPNADLNSHPFYISLFLTDSDHPLFTANFLQRLTRRRGRKMFQKARIKFGALVDNL